MLRGWEEFRCPGPQGATKRLPRPTELAGESPELAIKGNQGTLSCHLVAYDYTKVAGMTDDLSRGDCRVGKMRQQCCEDATDSGTEAIGFLIHK